MQQEAQKKAGAEQKTILLQKQKEEVEETKYDRIKPISRSRLDTGSWQMIARDKSHPLCGPSFLAASKALKIATGIVFPKLRGS